ncbi:hypothetical protein LRR18_04310 [Mangrovimonas sp. AS39]|uniref:hypothetical protein n=1 Tax=Mangrovimonas futianensis TaxID=2895523 RepID=UPI001E64CA41|nr:hypothetical protein [Mangrovimonas futianensis]MCF1190799.1 hypothetical protein [Mangrovimonas futianensis]MCF1194496.1 hypothetical protein [Mangrovimonas futianensis]
MKKIAIVHYLPLEFYPPITNLLEIASKRDLKFKVWSTHNNKKRKVFGNTDNVNIVRNYFPSVKEKGWIRLFKYFYFNLKCLMGLVFYSPDKVLYFESYSVWPVYWYLKICFKKPEIFIHYHEYCSKDWYKNGMKLVNFYHKYELETLYNLATWISQTNLDRVKLFLKDHPNIEPSKVKALPNYPPQKWSGFKRMKTSDKLPIKVVYVGAISLKDTYIKEFCEWVVKQEGRVIFDIYSYNLHQNTLEYLKGVESNYINFFEHGIEYDQIPEIINGYHVGVILYKATTINYKYNAPNKLFEYLAVGLNVWYPKVMMGIHPFGSSKVISLDFANLGGFQYEKEIELEGKKDSQIYVAEEALNPLINELER